MSSCGAPSQQSGARSSINQRNRRGFVRHISAKKREWPVAPPATSQGPGVPGPHPLDKEDVVVVLGWCCRMDARRDTTPASPAPTVLTPRGQPNQSPGHPPSIQRGQTHLRVSSPSLSDPMEPWGLGRKRQQRIWRTKKEKPHRERTRSRRVARQGRGSFSYLFVSGRGTRAAALTAGPGDTRRCAGLSLHGPRKKNTISMHRRDPQGVMHLRILDTEAGPGLLRWPENRRARARGGCSAGPSLGGAEIERRGRGLLVEIVV